MRKKQMLSGQYNVYTVFDKISKHYTQLYFASNDEDFIRLYLPSIILINPLRDIQIFKIGIFNDVTGEIKQTVKKRVSTDCYLFPHSRLSPVGENLSTEDMEKAIQTKKNELNAAVGSENNENKEEKENE